MKPIQLSPKFKPHDYQELYFEHAKEQIEADEPKWTLYSSPTGTGKSIMQLMTLSRIPGGLLITPRIEIINGMLDKCGYRTSALSEQDTIELAASHGIYTPIRLRNILARGDLNVEPNYLIVDECHHDLAQSYQDITMYLNGVPKIGLTATPYRGTPKSTQAFLMQWNDTINTVLTVRQAIEFGHCALPTPEVWALMDDDKFSVQAGDFKSKEVDDDLSKLYKEIVKRCERFFSTTSTWDRPTMFSVPTVDSARNLADHLNLVGLNARVITGATPYAKRQEIFKQCIDRTHALVQVNVVSEGVDLPIRRLIDCAPTISPVKWMQQIGRIMRPSNDPPEYYTICRNLERHGYLMEGAFPTSKIVEAQKAFETFKPPSARSATMRVLGTEGLNKFIATPVKLKNGLTVFTYHLNYQTQYKRSEFFVIVHPNSHEVMYFKKDSAINPDSREVEWGKWSYTSTIPPVDGFTSIKKKDELSPKQANWWNQQAQMKGLDPTQPLTNRVFSILPVLVNTNLSLK